MRIFSMLFQKKDPYNKSQQKHSGKNTAVRSRWKIEGGTCMKKRRAVILSAVLAAEMVGMTAVPAKSVQAEEDPVVLSYWGWDSQFYKPMIRAIWPAVLWMLRTCEQNLGFLYQQT